MGALSTLLHRANPAIRANRDAPDGGNSHDSQDSQTFPQKQRAVDSQDSHDSQRLDWNRGDGDSHESQDSQASGQNPSVVDSQDSQRLDWNEGGGDSHDSQDSQTFTDTLHALHRIANTEGVASSLVAALDARDVHACVGLSRDERAAYLRALARSQNMVAGRVPVGWARVTECDGCGPVWLWPDAPAVVIACPWCWHRKAGRTIPKPAVMRTTSSRRHPPRAAT